MSVALGSVYLVLEIAVIQPRNTYKHLKYDPETLIIDVQMRAVDPDFHRT